MAAREEVRLVMIDTLLTLKALSLPDGLVHNDFCLFWKVKLYVGLFPWWSNSGGLWLKNSSSLENLDDQCSPLSDHQQGAIFTTKLTKLQPHYNIL